MNFVDTSTQYVGINTYIYICGHSLNFPINFPTRKHRKLHGFPGISLRSGHGRQHRFVVGHRIRVPGTHLGGAGLGAVSGCSSLKAIPRCSM